MEIKRCLNCESLINVSQKFCPVCGQSSSTYRFTLSHFFHESFHAVTHADKGLFYLLKELAVRPGKVAREYIEGKRKKYFNPFTFFLLLMALYVFASTFVSKQKGERKEVPIEITNITDTQLKAVKLKQYERSLSARAFMSKQGNLVAMFAIPFFACYFWIIFYRRSFNYSEHLVANLMFVTFANLAFTLVVFPLQLVLKGTPWASVLFLFGFLLQAFYFTIAYKGLIQLKGFWAITKLAFFSIFGIILWAVVTMSAMAIYAIRNWHFYEYFSYLRY